MDQKLENQLDSGIEALEDLYKLGDSNISPILDRLHFHFSEVYREATETQKLSHSHSHIVEWLEKRVDDYVKTFYDSLNCHCEFKYIKNIENLSLESWNNLFEVFPKFISLATLFYQSGNVTLSVVDGACRLRCELNPDELISKREETYRLYRFFFSKHCLLTYKIIESDHKIEIEFELNTQEQVKDKKYNLAYDIGPEFVLGLPDGFSRYKQSLSDFLEIANKGKHPIFIINEDLTLIETDHVSHEFFGKDWNGEILHFAFLFRPISFIISSKGKRIFKSRFHENKTGCLISNSKFENKEGQDVVESRSKQYKNFDFFSIFNK